MTTADLQSRVCTVCVVSCSRAALSLATKGVIGRFAMDFVSVKEDGVWKHGAIEVNLRKGGTTHPVLTLPFLTDGTCDPETGLFYGQSGRPKYYCASDSLQSDQSKGIGASDLVDIAVEHELHFHSSTQVTRR